MFFLLFFFSFCFCCSFQKSRELTLDLSKPVGTISNFPVVLTHSDSVSRVTVSLRVEKEAELGAFDGRVNVVANLATNDVQVHVSERTTIDGIPEYCDQSNKSGCPCVKDTDCGLAATCEDNVCVALSCNEGFGGCTCIEDSLCFTPFSCEKIGAKKICTAPRPKENAVVNSAARLGVLSVLSLWSVVMSNDWTMVWGMEEKSIVCPVSGDVGAIVILVPEGTPLGTVKVDNEVPTSTTTQDRSEVTTVKGTLPAAKDKYIFSLNDQYGAPIVLQSVKDGDNSPTSSAEVSSRFDTKGIHFKAVVKDSSIETEGFTSTLPFTYDSLELLIDFDHSTLQTFNADDQQLFALPDQPTLYDVNGNKKQDTIVRTIKDDKGYILDIFIPYHVLKNKNDKSIPQNGYEMGFNAVLNNKQNGKSQHEQVFWVYGMKHHVNPSVWGTLQFRTQMPLPSTTTQQKSLYEIQLERLLLSTQRNTLNDDSPYIHIASKDLPKEQLYSPHQDYGRYLTGLPNAGQFRVSCEFSHFGYDDPIVLPGQSNRAHLHMFFGNTHANAYSTYDTLLNSGSSTCNGYELNRSSYWIPALIDPQGNLPIPDRLLVYYKAYATAVGQSIVYPENMQLVSGDAFATTTQPLTDSFRELFFRCYKPGTGGNDDQNTKHVNLPDCPSTHLLEMNIKFQTCWNGKDPSDYKNNAAYSNNWPTSGECPASHPKKLPQLEYRVFFQHDGKSSQWFLSSDVDPADGKTIRTHGRTLHADWFGGWNKDINKAWVDNCLNTLKADCNAGALGDPRIESNPKALKIQEQYNGPMKLSGEKVLKELCDSGKIYTNPASIAHCYRGL